MHIYIYCTITTTTTTTAATYHIGMVVTIGTIGFGILCILRVLSISEENPKPYELLTVHQRPQTPMLKATTPAGLALDANPVLEYKTWEPHRIQILTLNLPETPSIYNSALSHPFKTGGCGSLRTRGRRRSSSKHSLYIVLVALAIAIAVAVAVAVAVVVIRSSTIYTQQQYGVWVQF